MQSKLQIDELLKIAEEMGIYYELNSLAPGLFTLRDEEDKIMKTYGESRFSNGTICDYCSNIVLTKLGFEIEAFGKVFCCRECVEDFKFKKE